MKINFATFKPTINPAVFKGQIKGSKNEQKKEQIAEYEENAQFALDDSAYFIQEAFDIREIAYKKADIAVEELQEGIENNFKPIYLKNGITYKFQPNFKNGRLIACKMSKYDGFQRLQKQVYFKNNFPFKIREFSAKGEDRYDFKDEVFCTYSKNKTSVGENSSTASQVVKFYNNELSKIVFDFDTHPEDDAQQTYQKDLFIFKNNFLNRYLSNSEESARAGSNKEQRYDRMYEYNQKTGRLERVSQNGFKKIAHGEVVEDSASEIFERNLSTGKLEEIV